MVQFPIRKLYFHFSPDSLLSLRLPSGVDGDIREQKRVREFYHND
jgi:hypothetical protein